MNRAKLIDHTILKPSATEMEVRTLCQEAKQYGFASVCVNPCWVPLAAELLKETEVKVCTVIGFPLGANTTAVKALEALDALKNGAEELDMVINIGALKSKDEDTVLKDIQAIRALGDDFVLKVIIETSELTDEEKVKACTLATQAQADFVKTSTGFAKGGATAQDVALMRKTIDPNMQVKASGGIRSTADFDVMTAAGATRIGTSSGIKIAEGK